MLILNDEYVGARKFHNESHNNYNMPQVANAILTIACALGLEMCKIVYRKIFKEIH